MSRNFGLGSRNMGDAAQIALMREAWRKNISFSTAATVTTRFRLFSTYAKIKGVSRMENVNKIFVIDYGKSLAHRVDDEEISPSYAQNLLSSVNSVFRIVQPQNWVSVGPVNDCGIAKRSLIRKTPTLHSYDCMCAIDCLRDNGHERAALIVEFAYFFGLRSKEASLLDARKAARELDYCRGNKFIVEKGTKGGRKRKVCVEYGEGVDAVEAAARVQGNLRSIIPENETWKSWRENGLRKGRELLHELGIKGYHEFRAAYAARRYEEIVLDWEAPCNGGVIFDKNEDMKARKIIAKELGHGRIDVVASYIGGRS